MSQHFKILGKIRGKIFLFHPMQAITLFIFQPNIMGKIQWLLVQRQIIKSVNGYLHHKFWLIYHFFQHHYYQVYHMWKPDKALMPASSESMAVVGHVSRRWGSPGYLSLTGESMSRSGFSAPRGGVKIFSLYTLSLYFS